MAVDITPILSEVDSLCAADKANINSAIFEQYMQDESFTAHHEIQTEVRNGQLIPLIVAKPDYGFMKVRQGPCQMNECDYDATSSVKKWSPIDYNCRLIICKDTLDCDFRKFWNMNCKDYDNMNDAFMQFLAEKVKESVNASQWRIAYFDDSENEDPLYAGIDGLFKQMLAAAPVGSPNRFEIPENDGATIAEQMALDPARAYQIIRDMYNWAAQNNPGLLATPGIHFDVTPQLAFNYLAYLQENREINCCFSATDGITESRYNINNINYLGISIVIRHEWTRIIEWQQQTSGAVNYDNPHRAVLTYKGNKPVGTCDMDAFSNFDMFYEKKEKQIYIDVETSFDAKLLFTSDFAIAI